MPQIGTNEIRGGMKLELEKEPYVVVSNEFIKPGKGQPFNRIRVKHLKTGRVTEKTFKSGERIDLADVEELKMRLLYTEQDGAVFMNDDSFEQLTIPFSIIQENQQWLQEDTLYDITLYKGDAIEVLPPTFLEVTVTQTDPGVKGDTASGRVMKPSTIETGAKVQIPIFIDEGEKIKVDTRNGQYVSRV